VAVGKNITKETKAEFRQDFNNGDLYDIWHNIYRGNGYLSKWAKHRMKMVLKAIDSDGLGRRGLALDIGIGSGDLLEELTRRGSQAFGADFSLSMIQSYRDNHCHMSYGFINRLFLADVEALPIKSHTFDLVTCLGVLEYVLTDRKALADLYRIIRPGGYLILAVASYHRLSSIWNLLKSKVLGRVNHCDSKSAKTLPLKNQVRLIKPSDLLKETKKAGFEAKGFKCFGGKIWGHYFPIRFCLPKLIYIGDHCLFVGRKPT